MGDLGRLLARLAADDAFRGWLQREPDRALRGYALSDEERTAILAPGAAGAHLLARAARQMGIGEDAWAPGRTWEATGDAPQRPALEIDALPDAAVQLRIGPARAPDGRLVWSISLLPPGQEATPRVRGEHRPWLRVRSCDGQIGAWLAPEHPAEGTAVDVDGPRWAHRLGDAQQALAAGVRTAGGARLEAIEALLMAVSDPEGKVDARPRAAPPAEPPAGPAQLVVIGLGLDGVSHITREAEAAVRAARTVFSIDTSPAIRDFLSARCADVRPLFEAHYRAGSGRLPAYLHMAAKVLDAALDGGPVVLAVQGHPTMFSYIPVLLRDVAPLVGLRVRIQPGISSRAALLAELALDPADHGIQAFEATDLLLRRRQVSPDTLTLLWQVGNLETRLHSGRPSRPRRLQGLTDWLLTFFPEDHPVTGVVLGTHPVLPSSRWTVPLGELPSHAARIHAATTLVIPPIGRRALVDVWLAAVVDDPNHLVAITEPLREV